MKDIYELVRINNRYKKVIQAFVPNSNSSPLKKLMHIAFSQNEKMTDKECMLSIYGEINVPAFSAIKMKFKDILYKVILFQNDLSGFNETSFNEFANIYRQILAGRILITKRGYNGGQILMEKAINKAIKNNITEIVLTQCLPLIRKYSALDNEFKMNKYLRIYNKFQDYYLWETKADLYYYDLKKFQNSSLASASQDLIKKAEQYSSELLAVQNINTSKFIYNRYRVLELYYEFIKDFNKILLITDAFINTNTTENDYFFQYIRNIYSRKIYALIQTNHLDQAIYFGKSVLPNLIGDTNNWLRVSYYMIKAMYYKKEYIKGTDLLLSILNNEIYKYFGKVFFEIFSTLSGYAYLILLSGEINFNALKNGDFPEFKIGKFLNETPVFSKDKRGINVSILLLHIALLLQRKDYNSIIDRVDSLNQYAYRYLRKDDSFRSNCMIKMVIQMAKADFHPVRTERFTSDLRKKLNTVPLAGSGENIEIEFLPFEVLWEIMMNAIRPEKDRKPLA